MVYIYIYIYIYILRKAISILSLLLLLLLLFIYLLIKACSVTDSRGCPEGFEVFHRSCYWLSGSTYASWANAAVSHNEKTRTE